MPPAGPDRSTDDAGRAVEPGAPWEPGAHPASVGYPPPPKLSPAALLGVLLRTEGRVMLLLVAAGVLVAALWRALAPTVADSGNALETAAAVDGTLAGLGLVFGVLTAAGVLLRPGSLPVRRTIVAIVFSIVAGVISWQLGDRLGTPHLRAHGVALIWPIITSGGLFVGSLLPGTSRHLEEA
jgi:hypothetical protein